MTQRQSILFGAFLMVAVAFALLALGLSALVSPAGGNALGYLIVGGLLIYVADRLYLRRGDRADA